MKSLQRVLIMAGGTGGHVFPGLAVAQYLHAQGIEVHWLGTSQGLEARVVPAAQFPLHFINISGLRGKGIKPLLTAPINIARAVRQAQKIIKQIAPDVVIGMGGFVSGPGGVASWLAGRPLIIHEQNARAGMTNKILARLAKKVLQGFPGAFQGQSVMTVGNPVRKEIENLAAPMEKFNHRPSPLASCKQQDRPLPSLRSGRGDTSAARDHFVIADNPLSRSAARGEACPAACRRQGVRVYDSAPLHLLILGGSLGAQALNQAIPEMLSLLPAAERPEVFHQTGEKLFSTTQKLYESKQISANLVPFVEDMASAYNWADLVICRAGALTIAELCAAGLGAVLVPYPHAVDDHQTANAQFMVQHNAALCLQQNELTAERLRDIVKQFSQAPEQSLAMAQAAYQLRRVNVTAEIYRICQEICP